LECRGGGKRGKEEKREGGERIFLRREKFKEIVRRG